MMIGNLHGLVGLLLISGMFLVPSVSGRTLPASDGKRVDAQKVCVGPLSGFADRVADTRALDESLKASFIDIVSACKSVYLAELAAIEDDFSRLPQQSHCRELSGEFRQTLENLNQLQEAAHQLPIETEREKKSALSFFSMAGPGLTRAVNDLFLLRYGICREEAATLVGIEQAQYGYSVP
ncbi:MAG TPA: hypothetical protein ENI17_16490 [Pseudomonas xinjiangensis]|nr:hypothetical protein [Halopseudomonas xinjiangensis]